MVIKDNFSIKYGHKKIVGDVISLNGGQNVLFLHGGGTSSKKDFDTLREFLAEKNINSYSFDFIGHGDSEGNINISSLQKRTDQAASVIELKKLSSKPLSVIASSMGGYAAIKLTELFDIQNLILIAPAVYTPLAYDVDFGPEFSKIIRKEYSWRDSDAWKILKKYKGNLLVFSAEHDQVIPGEVIDNIYNSSEIAKSKELIVVKNANHSLIKWLNSQPVSLRLVSDKIINLVKKL